MSAPTVRSARTRPRTRPVALDPEMRGRTYAIPFAAVWAAALFVAKSRMMGWKVVGSDDLAGEIEVHATSRAFRLPARILVSVALDANAQTQVKVAAARLHWGVDWGVNVRRVRRFLHALDEMVARYPGESPDQRPSAAIPLGSARAASPSRMPEAVAGTG